MCRPLALVALAATGALACAPVATPPTTPAAARAAAAPPPPGCDSPVYHRLDFWLGAWDVTDQKGAYDGTNVIRRGLGGCTIEESWLDAAGWRGESVFYVDRRAGAWKQLWVTQAGQTKEKQEVAPGPAGSIRFAGALDTTTLTPLAGGGVLQRIEPNGGGAAWVGTYKKLPSQCDTPAHHEFDFWVGDWTVLVKSRTAPDRDEWTQATGSNHVTSILNGCAVEERFTAQGGPVGTWTGRSHSVYVAAQKRWRQTWVDDSGNYIALTGGVQDGEMVLVGEPRPNGRVMRMVYGAIAGDRFTWRWEASTDGQKTWQPMMVIEYARLARG